MKEVTFQSVSVLTGVIFLLPGCAGLINGSTQEISITSNPSEANVSVEGLQLKTPANVNLSRKASHTAKFEKEGYEPAIERMERRPSWWILLDALWGLLFFIPLLTDLGSGGFYAFDDEVHVNLTKSSSAKPTAPASPSSP
ncbi:MAG: PEGA domain-containing protein [Nitrospiria bacterium]